ncbi:unnamed protein product (macronuclear) [Paramecium tetraurelia]|uniref:EF-hand domain-containing protein n=1 Tax=Paramecium tetraurelia TaxID=5888 RepID=A0EIH5_PARTE|nr:uncharacterized protein GSPATT00027445001 [Paramecium tetraurelia]CAK95116.1 unnamed protein product [Paramecium tetraurelia]|eukprot:XP_001462489.1 hypothetical protein (macronuclear) [Paramecium tetraurelia strain d4-2]
MDEQIINVIFDPNFTSFDSDLANMSLDKMMQVTFSEEILQKNFSVIISILKQLHKGMILINGQVKDNSDWVQKLREESQQTDTKDKVDVIDSQVKEIHQNFATKAELQALKQRFDNILRDQDIQIKEIAKAQEQEQQQINKNAEDIIQKQQQIDTINEELDKLRKLITDQNKLLSDLSSQKPDTNVYQIQSKPLSDDSLKDVLNRLAQLESQYKELLKQMNNQPKSLLQPISLKDQDYVEQPNSEVDLSDINKKLDNHEEEIQKLFELVDELRKKNREGVTGGASNVDAEDLLIIKNDIKKLFTLLEQLQTQLNLASFGNSGEEGNNVGENQMVIILAEINKIRALLENYATQSDLTNLGQKVALQQKQTYDHIDEEIEKVRREFKLNLNKKGDLSEQEKIKNELTQLKDILNKSKRGSQPQLDNSPTKGPQLSPDFLNTFKELQDQVAQNEQELINHKSQFQQNSQQIQLKIAEIENKMKQTKTDSIISGLQELREIQEQMKKDQDTNKAKIAQFGKKIDGVVTREDLLALFEPKLKQVRDELTKQIEELRIKLEKKAELEDLEKLQNDLVSRLEEVVQALIKQLANKSETKKALIYLEQRINQIFMMLEGEGGSKDQEGLFAKKQLWSCASCDKELDKFKGQLGDYRGWAHFPPKETSPERMGRFGVGYKQMQDKSKNNRDKIDKERYQNDKDRPNSQANQQFYQTGSQMSQSQNNLPKINK